MRIIVGIALMLMSNLAWAGQWEGGIIEGRASAYAYDDGPPVDLHMLMANAEENAWEKCAYHFVQRVTDYQVFRRRAVYANAWSVAVEAKFGCGDYLSDY